MPVVFVLYGFRFFFYSNEGDPREPVHIHVRKDRNLAKFWLEPEVRLAGSSGFSAVELNRISKIINTRRIEIAEAWNEHFNS
ncbi:MAG: DUF4160 domain-containing protein [Pyrinomonadaceae bacterium]